MPGNHQSGDTGEDLRHHGDSEVAPGLVDLAVNVRIAPMPVWLRVPLLAAMDRLAAYPDQGPAVRAVARRHRRHEREVLLTAGAAQAFTLLAQALRPRCAVVVHPQFTEPEAALRAAGRTVRRVVLPPPYRLDASLVPHEADLVVIGNPTNPTSVAHPVEPLLALARPGRILVVDEAFIDTVEDTDRCALAERGGVPGLVVIRSLTKTWGLAGLRVGYLLAPSDVVAALRAVQPLWPVSTPALAAVVACTSPTAAAAERAIAATLARDRDRLLAGLRALPGVAVMGEPASSFVLVRVEGAAQVRVALRRRGFAVRRGDTFPGLGPDFIRVAVREATTTDAFLAALAAVLRHESATFGP